MLTRQRELSFLREHFLVNLAASTGLYHPSFVPSSFLMPGMGIEWLGLKHPFGIMEALDEAIG